LRNYPGNQDKRRIGGAAPTVNGSG
jgi:hypothetical protein